MGTININIIMVCIDSLFIIGWRPTTIVIKIMVRVYRSFSKKTYSMAFQNLTFFDAKIDAKSKKVTFLKCKFTISTHISNFYF